VPEFVKKFLNTRNRSTKRLNISQSASLHGNILYPSEWVYPPIAQTTVNKVIANAGIQSFCISIITSAVVSFVKFPSHGNG
jgi:hypothetical protein